VHRDPSSHSNARDARLQAFGTRTTRPSERFNRPRPHSVVSKPTAAARHPWPVQSIRAQLRHSVARPIPYLSFFP
jgi:hypothetical protein